MTTHERTQIQAAVAKVRGRIDTARAVAEDKARAALERQVLAGVPTEALADGTVARVLFLARSLGTGRPLAFDELAALGRRLGRG